MIATLDNNKTYAPSNPNNMTNLYMEEFMIEHDLYSPSKLIDVLNILDHKGYMNITQMEESNSGFSRGSSPFPYSERFA